MSDTTQRFRWLQMPEVCTACREEQHGNALVKTVRYKFLGHMALHVDEEVCTFFHAVFNKTWSRSHVLLDFPEDFTVGQFLEQQALVLPFDNQIHVSHWNLVHVSPFQQHGENVYKIFEHHLLMNNIPPDFLHNMHIHAIDVRIRPTYYLPGVVTNEDQTYYEQVRTAKLVQTHRFPGVMLPTYTHYYNSAHCTAEVGENFVARAYPPSESHRHFAFNFTFRGHCVDNISLYSEKRYEFVLPKFRTADGTLLNFAPTFRVCDFLIMMCTSLKIDHQLHVTHWNLVHAAAPLTYKIFDHHLYMNAIPTDFWGQLEIHALDARTQGMFYLDNVVSNDVQAYFRAPIQPTVVVQNVQHPTGRCTANEHYYRQQRGGHGLFNNTGACYDEHGLWLDYDFSKYVQDNPFSITQ